MTNEKKTIELDEEVLDALLFVLRKMAHAGRDVANNLLVEGAELNKDTLATLAQASLVDYVYRAVKKANKKIEVDELEKIFSLEIETE